MTGVHAGFLMKRSVSKYAYHEYMCIIMLSEKSVQLCAKADNCVLELTQQLSHADNICVVESSKSSSVMHALHTYIQLWEPFCGACS